LEQLEERIVLDAAVNADQHDNPDQQDANQNAEVAAQSAQGGGQQPAPPGTSEAALPAAAGSSDPSLGQVVQQDLKVVLVPNALGKIEAISNAAVDGAQVIVYDAQQDNLASVVAALDQLADATGRKIGTIGIVGHGAEGVLTIGSDTIDILNLSRYLPSFEMLAHNMTEDAQIQFFSCSTAGDLLGQALLNGIALHTGADVFASSDVTGGERGDWVLEYASDGSVAIHSLLEAGRLGSDSAELGLSDFTNSPTGLKDLMAVESADYKRLYFLAREPGDPTPPDQSADMFIWWTDILGSDPVKVVITDANTDASNFDLIMAFDGKLLFTAQNAAHGQELYVHDPATGTTRMLNEIWPGSNFGRSADTFAVFDGELYFRGKSGFGFTDYHIWWFDSHGGADGLGSVARVAAAGLADNVQPNHLTAGPDGLYFEGCTWVGFNSIEDLWKYDPAAGIAVNLSNSPDDVHDFAPLNFVLCGDSIFFGAKDWYGPGSYDYNYKVFQYQASTGLTNVVDVDGNHVDAWEQYGAFDVGGKLIFFSAEHWLYTYEPGADHAVEVAEGNFDFYEPYTPRVYGDLLMYPVGPAGGGDQGTLWRTDGTEAGTFALDGVSILYPDWDVRYQFSALSYDGYFLFTATDWAGAYGFELWRTDGTQAGTILAQDIYPGSMSSYPSYLTKVNPLFFVADTAAGTGIFSWVVPAPLPPAAPGGPAAGIAADVVIDPGAVKDPGGFLIHLGRGAHHGTTHPIDLPMGDGREGFFLGADIELTGLRGPDFGWERILAWLGSLDASAPGAPDHGLGHPEQFWDTGLFGWAEHVQDGAVLVFDLDHIRVSSLVLDTDEGAGFKLPAIASLDELKRWSDFEVEWMRLVDECRGRCTGSLGFVDLLLQTKPAADAKNGPV